MQAPEASRLLLVVHHHAIDNLSRAVVLADLAHALDRMERGEPAGVQRPPVSYPQWARALAAHARSDEVRRTEGYRLAPARHEVGRLPVDQHAGPNSEAPRSRAPAGARRARTAAPCAAPTRCATTCST
jgi:hypothetical protein